MVLKSVDEFTLFLSEFVNISDEMPFRKVVGQRIREARLAKHWSQEELAHAADLDRAYVGCLERGERNPSLATLHRIAKALGVKLASLVNDLPR